MTIWIKTHRRRKEHRSVFAVTIKEIAVVMTGISTFWMRDWLSCLMNRIVVERCDHVCDRSHLNAVTLKWSTEVGRPTVQVVPHISGKTYRIVCGTALGSLCVIVFTGALVRLTNSGLGCSDWPNCNNTKFVDVSSSHTAIEQLNRLFTGVVSFSVIAAVLMSHLRRPRRNDLLWLSWSLVAGVLAQIVIGGIVVLTGLNPYANMAHFLVSMVLIACAFMLFRRSATEAPRTMFRSVPEKIRLHTYAIGVLGVVAIVTGTVVTATGPHAGDENAVRFGFALTSVARVHSVSVISFLIVVLLTALIIRKEKFGPDVLEPISTLLFVSVMQAAVGYTQYFTGVPVVLVAAHIIGAVSLFLAICHLLIAPPDVVSVDITGPAM